MFGDEDGTGHRLLGIGGTAFLNDVLCAIDDVTPWAAMPVVIAGEIKDAFARDIEGHIIVGGELIEEVAGIGTLVAATAIISAAHVGPGADALEGPLFPLKVGIFSDRDYGRFLLRQ